MNILFDLKNKYSKSGVTGVAASGLRVFANYIETRGKKAGNGHARHKNDFIRWIHLAVPGMLMPSNIKAMEHAIMNMPKKKAVVEIGSFCGLSTVVLSYLLCKYEKEALLFSCDKWVFEGYRPGEPLGDSPSVSHDTYREYVKNTFLNSTRNFASDLLPHTIECFSDDFFGKWFNEERVVDVFDREVDLGGEIGFCYIDGNHTYDFARRDFENCDRAPVAGGFVFFDDSGDDSGWEVNRLVKEVMERSDYKLITNNPNYLFRKVM